MKSVFAFAVLFAGYAAAQSTTASAAPPVSTGDISPCVLTCSTTAAQTAGCSSFTDLTCVCTSTTFQQAALECLQSSCPDEVASAVALQSQLCGAAGSASPSGSAPVATSSAAETETDTEATGSSTVPVSATAPVSSSRAVSSASATSRAVSSSVSRSASAVASASASAAGTNAASAPFNFATTGVWAAVALGGVAVAQLVL